MNEPLPSQRIQLNPSKIPTEIGHSVVTEREAVIERRMIRKRKITEAAGQPSICEEFRLLPEIGLTFSDDLAAAFEGGLPCEHFSAFKIVRADHGKLGSTLCLRSGE